MQEKKGNCRRCEFNPNFLKHVQKVYELTGGEGEVTEGFIDFCKPLPYTDFIKPLIVEKASRGLGNGVIARQLGVTRQFTHKHTSTAIDSERRNPC